jgi:HSP20 family protein
MTLAFWEPFRDFDRFDRVVNDLLGRDAYPRSAVTGTRAPATDLASDKEGYVFRFDVPGIPKDRIDISIENDVLTVSGERPDPFAGDEERTVYRRETPRGKFERAFRLPEDADAQQVAATYADGVLEVRVPRVASVQPRRIPIAAS